MWTEPWMRDAACVDNPNISMEDMFPEDLFDSLHSPEAVAHLDVLRSLCADCLVHEECREWADQRHYEVGFIAGETHVERAARWRRIRRAAAPLRVKSKAPVTTGRGGPALP